MISHEDELTRQSGPLNIGKEIRIHYSDQYERKNEHACSSFARMKVAI